MKKFTYKKLSKAISFIILSIAFAINAHSQTWCPAGATWYYTDNSADISGYSKLTYTIDTLINSINCKKITHYYQGEGWQGPYSFYGSPFYTHEQNGVAYLYNNKDGNNKFDTLFDINAQVGDKWRMTLVDTLCNDTLYFMKVLNTGVKNINGFNLKWLYVKAGPVGGSFPYGFDTITERLGYRYDDINYALCYNSPDEFAHGGLRCYSDDAFGVYSTGLTSSCDYLTDITESHKKQGLLKIYPNPARNSINFEVNFEANDFTNSFLIITDVVGRQNGKYNISAKNSALVVNTATYSNGIYFYSVYNNGVLKETEKFIISK